MLVCHPSIVHICSNLNQESARALAVLKVPNFFNIFLCAAVVNTGFMLLSYLMGEGFAN